MTSKILIFENSHLLTEYLLKRFLEESEKHGQFNIALSGGQTPVEFYGRLAQIKQNVLWQKTHIFLADERFVPLDDADSNFRMIKQNLLQYVVIPQENVHPVPVQADNLGLSVEEYKNTILKYVPPRPRGLPSFDFILLGVGEDGHTASLFPGLSGIDDPRRMTIPVSMPHLKNERLSLTLSLINQALLVAMVITGKKKAGIVKTLIEDPTAYFPAAKVSPVNGELLILCDREAASKLAHPEKYIYRRDEIPISE